ncbi:unnamed protein product [Gordionus sp. m RMFG-2023]
MLCSNCNIDAYKYKCPKCSIKLCSVFCSNLHKTLTCENNIENSKSIKSILNLEDGEIMSDEESEENIQFLQKLKNSAELMEIIQNPNVIKWIKAVNANSNKLDEALNFVDFEKFADECHKIFP